jgi:uncharacterized protein YunC (DUF1805 family)
MACGRLAMNASNYQLYEARKAAWIATHKDATHSEYEEAMKRLAKECGI